MRIIFSAEITTQHNEETLAGADLANGKEILGVVGGGGNCSEVCV